MAQEEWAQVRFYEGIYEVSSLGNLRSLYGPALKGKKIKVYKLKTGLKCYLSRDGKYKTFFLGEVVATAFLGRPKNHQALNYKDGDKMNHCLENLEWVGVQENECALA